MLSVGLPLPVVVVPNQRGELVDLAQLNGKRVPLLMYLRADSPRDTPQARGLSHEVVGK